jgi:hypothetical protein
MNEYENYRNAYAQKQINASQYKPDVLGQDTPREGDVTRMVRSLAMAIGRLEEALHDLGSVLIPVTRQEPVENTKELLSPPPSVPLAMGIFEQERRVNEMVMLVRQQIELTEL